VAATSAKNAWAVGYELAGADYRTLIEHWDGHTWKQVPSPSPSSSQNVLTGVAATSGNNAWAVGYDLSRVYQTLIEHWDGHTWKPVRSPTPSSIGNFLTGVATASAKNAWAVGYDFGSANYRTLIEHWNGHTWQKVASANVGPAGRFNELTGATAISSGDAWAAGYYLGNTADQTLIEHWNGHAWKLAATPDLRGAAALNVLDAVSAASSGKVWAVGRYSDGAALQTLGLRCG
jgi:hypothetical protein